MISGIKKNARRCFSVIGLFVAMDLFRLEKVVGLSQEEGGVGKEFAGRYN